MARKSNEFEVGPHWHQDFRDVATLPEDRVVRLRFLTNAWAGVLALGLLILVGWQLFARYSASAQLRFWDEEIATHQREHDELQLLLRDYLAESAKIGEVHRLIYSPMVVSELLLNLGRTLPETMSIDMVEYTRGIVTVRGYLVEPPERASRVLGQYLETLRKDAQIGPLFNDISAPGFGRPEKGDQFLFELQLKPL